MFSGSLMEGYISVIIFGWIPSDPADLVSYSFFSTTSVEKKMLKLSRVLYFTCKLANCRVNFFFWQFRLTLPSERLRVLYLIEQELLSLRILNNTLTIH